MPVRPLERFLIQAPLEELHLETLRARFPSIRFERTTLEALSNSSTAEEALLLGYETLDLEKLSRDRPGLHWIQTFSAGVDRWTGSALQASHIEFTTNSGVHGPNIAEHVLATILAFARDLPSHWESTRNRTWTRKLENVFEVQGQTLAIFGLGSIGRALAVRAAALGLEVTGVRRRPDGELPPGVSRVVSTAESDAVLSVADHVVNILPLTPDTRDFFSRQKLSRFRKGARFYNVGRGATTDTLALADLLRSGHLAGAALDVTEPEPLPPDHPLWAAPNILITSHTAGWTPRYQERTLSTVIENLQRRLQGAPLLNLVDKQLGY
jgi:phosphoglycerate dehydrogenase-like enzyme